MNTDITEGEVVEATALAVKEGAAPLTWTPRFVMTVDDAVHMIQEKRRFFDEVMTEGLHYGKVPGAAKPSLWKPGAELLLSSMGLTSECFNEEPPILDVMGTEHNGEPFIRYSRGCRVFKGPPRDGFKLSEAGGSCNSWEPKYRYRNEERTCPNCGKQTIIKGKEQFGGGWLCWKKSKNGEGCGSKWPDGAKEIEGQAVGKIANPDIMDIDNTFKKMADKRAVIAATLLATGCSDIFTQDIEDFGPDGNADPEPTSKPAVQAAKPAASKPERARPQRETVADQKREVVHEPHGSGLHAAAAAGDGNEQPTFFTPRGSEEKPSGPSAHRKGSPVDLINAGIERKLWRDKVGFVEWTKRNVPGGHAVTRSSDVEPGSKLYEAVQKAME